MNSCRGHIILSQAQGSPPCTVGQVAPGWCLLSSVCQFGKGIPKSHLHGIAVPEQPHQKLTNVLAFPELLTHFHSCQAISNHFHLLPSHFQLLPATFSNVKHSAAILWPFKKKLQPFPAISRHFQSFLRHSVTFREYMNSHNFI